MIFRRSYSDPFRRNMPAAAFDPGTLAVAAIGTSLLGAGVSAAGMASQSQAQAAQANYQSQVARNNAILDQRNAAIVTQQGEVNAQDSAMKTMQEEGAQKAALASQGGDIDTGTNADIIGDTAMAGKTDQDTIRYNAAMQAYGYDVAATGATGTANAYESAAANDTAAAPLGVGASLLGGVSSASGKWYNYMTHNPGSPSTGLDGYTGNTPYSGGDYPGSI